MHQISKEMQEIRRVKAEKYNTDFALIEKVDIIYLI